MAGSPPAVAPLQAPQAGNRPTRVEALKPVRTRRYGDLGMLAALAGLTALAQPHLFAPETLASLDSVSQFYPWYAFLGQALRAGHIPGWNPAVFSGTPFAANPLSGWTYLPAMVLFTVLPMSDGARLYLLFHPLLAGFGAFALARVLGLDGFGAVLAGVAYANTSFFQVQNLCCFAFASVYAWLPLALLGVELAVLSDRWVVRIAWWGLAALAVSQILAAWLGQGAYYALLMVGGYIAFRTLVVVPAGLPDGAGARLRRLLAHTAGVLLFGAALDAAGLLPRLEFNALSNLAGGYAGREASVGGLHPKDWILLITPGFWYAGASVLALAAFACVVIKAPLRHQLAYFGSTSLLALLVTGTVETPLHWLLYRALPGFARLHPHAPERILTIAYLGPALLAGAAVSALRKQSWWGRALHGVARAGPLVSTLVVLVIVADLANGSAKARADWALTDPLNGGDKLTPVDLGTYYQPNAAAAFLQSRLKESPDRYMGYAPSLDGEPWPYSTRFLDARTSALQVDNRALPLGLEDVQGYDASHLARYDAYLAALNGRTQNYHDAEVFPAGLSSRLLDLLNLRYLVIPRQPPLEAGDAAALGRFTHSVYADSQVQVLENPSALPRAWVVHAARQAAQPVALADLTSGQVDPREVALLEEAPPPLAPASEPALDRAAVTEDSPDHLVVSTSSDSAGLLMISEVHYPAWKAYVDSQPVGVYAADGALQAVAVPAGGHTVELRFESTTLRAGSLVSAAAIALLMVFTLLPLVVAARLRGVRSQ
ncbi:MAG: hypothetical protein ACR2IK_21835 [Chloroflexota bacterium]